MPKGLGLGGAGGQNFNFLNMVMWHIKLTRMSSRPGYTENFYSRIKLVTLGVGLNDQIPLDIFESVGIYDGAPSCVLVKLEFILKLKIKRNDWLLAIGWPIVAITGLEVIKLEFILKLKIQCNDCALFWVVILTCFLQSGHKAEYNMCNHVRTLKIQSGVGVLTLFSHHRILLSHRGPNGLPLEAFGSLSPLWIRPW